MMLLSFFEFLTVIKIKDYVNFEIVALKGQTDTLANILVIVDCVTFHIKNDDCLNSMSED